MIAEKGQSRIGMIAGAALVISVLTFAFLAGSTVYTYSTPEVASSCGASPQGFAISENASGAFTCTPAVQEVAEAELTSQSGSTTVTSYQSPTGSPSTFQSACYVIATGLGVLGTVSCAVTYTEANTGSSRTITFFTLNTINAVSQSNAYIWVAPNTQIRISTTVAVSATYNVAAWIIRIT